MNIYFKQHFRPTLFHKRDWLFQLIPKITPPTLPPSEPTSEPSGEPKEKESKDK